MSDFVFFIKLFLLTVALVLVMQVHVGERTLESHAMSWVQTSVMVEPLDKVAHGAAKVTRDLASSIHAAIEKNTGKKKKDETPVKGSSFHWFHHAKTDSNESTYAK